MHALCIYCAGEGCPACRETGVELDESQQQAAIDEFEAKKRAPPVARLEAAYEAWKRLRFL
jgi:hypothetical protein